MAEKKETKVEEQPVLTEEATIQDVLTNQTLSTDRIELALENQTALLELALDQTARKICKEVSASASSSSISSPTSLPSMAVTDFKHELRSQFNELNSSVGIAKVMLCILVGAVVFCGLTIMSILGTIATNMTYYQNGTYTEPVKASDIDTEANGSEQNTSNEEEASPQKNDQSNQQQ